MSVPDLGRFDVSRETVERLETYAALLTKWNRSINLVSRTTLPELWERHIIDSLQLWPLRPERCRNWIDLGSGGGLPGLVIAACDAALPVTLVERDERKAAFLATASREMGLATEIRTAPIETVKPAPFQVISARALAPLPALLPLMRPFRGPGSIALIPKGRSVESELTQARAGWKIDYEKVPSITDDAAAILRIREFDPLP